VSAAEALLQLARSFGAAGKAYTDLTYSDEFVAAYEAVEAECDGRVDRATKEGFEAAYCAGRREWRLAGGWRTAWTTAQADYDGFGTETAEGPFEWEGKQIRRVLIDPEFFSWQTARYGSGGHGDWDEDPRVTEAKRIETLARERFEIEVGKARYAGGLFWLRDLDDAALESADDFEDKFFDELSARGLTWKDLRAEQRARRDKRAAVERAAKWAVCRAAFKDGDTLIDAGTEGYRTSFGWVPGQEPRAWQRCEVKPHYACEDDASQAMVVSNDDLRSSVGTLETVALLFASGRMRVAGPEDVIPPRAVVERIGVRFDEIARVEAFGKVAWVGRPVGSVGALVVDDEGHLVRAKKLREAAESVQRVRYFGGVAKRSFKLFDCVHIQTRAVRFTRDGVDPSLLKIVSVCVACGAFRVMGSKEWRDAGCLELNVGGPRDGYACAGCNPPPRCACHVASKPLPADDEPFPWDEPEGGGS
jgi:hypothetical protein